MILAIRYICYQSCRCLVVDIYANNFLLDVELLIMLGNCDDFLALIFEIFGFCFSGKTKIRFFIASDSSKIEKEKSNFI